MEKDEAARLRAVHALGLLDTPAEQRFDRLARFAQRLFDVPVVAINLVDESRQWNKAAIGLEPWLPRADSVCDTTVSQEGPHVVADLRADQRFASLPAVAGEDGVRFYAGQPLVSDGQRVGALCIADHRPRQLDPRDVALLAELAGMVEREMSVADDLEQAAEVQRRLMPSRPPAVTGLDVAGRCTMSRSVGGDFYDWYFAQGRLQVVLGDVMGKGIPAALIAASVRALLRGASRFNDIEEMLARVAFSLEQDLSETGTFVTAFAARVDPDTGETEYVDAGHGLAVVLQPDGGVRHLATDGMPVGAITDDRWTSKTTNLAPGEALVAVSDGVLDAVESPREAVAVARELHARCGSAQELADAITRRATEQVLTDDVTVLVVRRPESAAPWE